MSDTKSKYIEQVMSLFGIHKEIKADGQAVPARSKPTPIPADITPVEPRSAQQQEKRDSEIFDDRLRDFVSLRDTRDGVVAGRVHMLNTDNVRKRLGSRWLKFADRVHDIIKTEFKVRLGPRDLFTKVNESSYVIVFGDCSEVEARLKIAMISEQILEKLLGEAEAKDIEALGVQRLVTRSDGTVAAEAIENTETLVAMLEQAEESGDKTETYDFQDVAAGRRALTPEEVSRLVGDVDSEIERIENGSSKDGTPIVKIDRLRSLMTQLAELENAMCAEVPVFSPTKDKIKAEAYTADTEEMKPVLKRILETRARAEQQIVFLYDQDPTVANQVKSEVSLKADFFYHPMWHAPSNKIAVYMCQAILRDGEGRALKLREMDKDQEADVLAIVDRMALRKVRTDLDNAVTRGKPNIMMVPVHFSTLHRHGSRVSFLEICNQIPRSHKRVMSWEILESHFESWSLQLKSIVTPIVSLGSAIFLRLPNLQENLAGVRRNLPYLRAAGVHAVGIDAAALRGSESEKLHLLENIADLAGKHDLKCYGHGFHSLSMTICAVCMGYQHVSGPAIAAPTAEPDGIRATAMENIYGQLLFKGATSGEMAEPESTHVDDTPAG